jgi:Cu/Ag efflux protein CusF
MKLVKLAIAASVMAFTVASCGGGGSNNQQQGSATAESSAKPAKEEKVDASEKKIPFKHGSYVQVNKAFGMEVKNTVYFDNWGDWTATENKSDMQMFGQTIKTDKIEIVKGNMHWDIDLIAKTGRQYKGFELPPEVAAAMGTAIGGAMMEGMEVEELGTEMYIGYNCKKTRTKHKEMEMDITTWTLGKLAMKTEGKMGGMELYTAITELSENAPPKSKFEVPEGIEMSVEN